MKTFVSSLRVTGAAARCRTLWKIPNSCLWLEVPNQTGYGAICCAHQLVHTGNAASSRHSSQQTATHAAKGKVKGGPTDSPGHQAADVSASSPSSPKPPVASSAKGVAVKASAQRVLVLKAADSFAQSRMKNYVQRILAKPAPAAKPDDAPSAGAQMQKSSLRTKGDGDCDRGNHSSHTSVAPSLFEIVPRRLSREEAAQYAGSLELAQAYGASFSFPVDVFVSDKLTRRFITARGVAGDAKSAVVAACMHAERCLDALRIPLFTSQQRQHQRALQAQAEGRTAAEVTDVPVELSSVVLPEAVALPSGAAASTMQRLASYQPPRDSRSAHAATSPSRQDNMNDAHAEATGGQGGAAGLAGRRGKSRRTARRRPPRRFENYTTRYSANTFMRATLSELAALQSTLFDHNRPADEDGDGGGEGAGAGRDEMERVDIAPDEVAILQPELLPPSDLASGTYHRLPIGSNGGADGAASAGASVGHRSLPPAAAQNLVRQYAMKLPHSHSTAAATAVALDESEGGLYHMVESGADRWYWEPEAPGPWCLQDTYAVSRISGYLARTRGHAFRDAITTHFTEEETYQFVEEKRRYVLGPLRWYIVKLELPEIKLSATGKAMSQAAAENLCAMHAELLLGWFGIPLYTNPHAQALYYDACLKWGRHIAAEPIDPSMVHAMPAKLPKPLKELQRTWQARKRGSERNVMEKLLLLNRCVVHLYRTHIIEVDLFANDMYAELLALAEPCVRSFMVAVGHPYESAFFNLVYSKDSQMRTTVYLPLPERYGIRGGYAVATTPQHGKTLAALSAVDNLCALDVIPQACMAQPRWQRMLELRESFGLVLPPSYAYARRLAAATSDAARAALGPPPALPHPYLRSPPSYREAIGFASTIPAYEDVWRIMLLDADVFDVIPTTVMLQESSMAHCNRAFIPLLSAFMEEAVAYVFHWPPEMPEIQRHMHQYVGTQHFHNVLKTAANNCWMELPLDAAVYGRRIALGRCLSRRGAHRALCVHTLRILHTLKLLPWDVMSTKDLMNTIYAKKPHTAIQRMREWKWLCAALLDGRFDELDAQQPLEVPEAEITKEVVLPGNHPHGEEQGAHGGSASADKRHILSPHPVMTREAATPTLNLN